MTPAPLTRRDFIRAALAGSAGASLAVLAGCTGAEPGRTSTPPQGPTTRTLLAYFSRAGENYWYGGRRTSDVGNTDVRRARSGTSNHP